MTGGPAGLELPASTAGFLASCARLARVLLDLAEAVSRWADDLSGVSLPHSVVSPLRIASGALSGAARAVSTAALCAVHAAQAASVPEPARTRLLALLSQEGGASVREAATALGESRMTVWRWLDALRAADAAEMHGKVRGARWHLTFPAPGRTLEGGAP